MQAKTTECPSCHTRFRVSADQLEAAEGLVRCGRCMQIFNAVDPLATPIEQPGAPPETLSPPPRRAQTRRSDAVVPPPRFRLGQHPTHEPEPRPDPLQLVQSLSTEGHDFEHHMPARPPRRWPWALANIAALLALVAQLAWWQMPHLLASPLGPHIETYCQRFGIDCEDRGAPVADSTSELSTRKLVVRQHPERDNALLVDALLVNRGDAPSPFPALHLRFTDINSRPVASRVFQPQEYLSGELSELSQLASRQPLHLILEIRDPGPEAVNYELTLQPARSASQH